MLQSRIVIFKNVCAEIDGTSDEQNVLMKEKERERERERERGGGGQTDRQSETETEKQRVTLYVRMALCTSVFLRSCWCTREGQ